MAVTPHIAATLVETAQAQKEVTVNEALVRLDALLNTGAIDKDASAPPGSPAAGDVYIVGAGASGAWAGQSGKLAYFDQVWRFIAPRPGLALWVNDEQALYRYTGAAWELALAAQRTRCLRLQPGLLRPAVSGGCAPLAAIALGAGQPDIQTLDFDASVSEQAQALLALPRQWDRGTVYAQLVWSHAAASGSYGVVWELAAVAMGDGEALGASFGSAVTVTDTGGAAGTLYLTGFSPQLTVAGSPQLGDAVFLRVARKAADAADTLAVDARLHEVRLYYVVTESANE